MHLYLTTIETKQRKDLRSLLQANAPHQIAVQCQSYFLQKYQMAWPFVIQAMLNFASLKQFTVIFFSSGVRS